MNEPPKICPLCGVETWFIHLHSEAHGLSGTHIDGSEHFKCTKCGQSIFSGHPLAFGFPFVLDKTKTLSRSNPENGASDAH